MAAAAAGGQAAKAKARVELLRQLDADEAKNERAHGFADTQPLGNS